MSTFWKVLRHRTVATIVVIGVLIAGWSIAMAAIAPSKLSPELSAAMNTEDDSLRVAVELGFVPERFHTLRMQEFGNVMQVDGNTIHVRSLAADEVMTIAQLYWVQSLDLIQR